MLVLEFVESGQIRAVVTGGEFHRLNETVSDSAHGGNHHCHAFTGLLGKHNFSRCSIALGIGYTCAAKLVNDPFGNHFVATLDGTVTNRQRQDYASSTLADNARKDRHEMAQDRITSR